MQKRQETEVTKLSQNNLLPRMHSVLLEISSSWLISYSFPGDKDIVFSRRQRTRTAIASQYGVYPME